MKCLDTGGLLGMHMSGNKITESPRQGLNFDLIAEISGRKLFKLQLISLVRIWLVNKEKNLPFIPFHIFGFLCHLPADNFSFFFTHKLLISAVAPGMDGRLTKETQMLEGKKTHKACCKVVVHSISCVWTSLKRTHTFICHFYSKMIHFSSLEL